MTIAERIIQLRTCMGWSRRDLARRMFLSDAALYKIEKGFTIRPHASTIATLRQLEGAYSDRLERYRLGLDPDDPTQFGA